MGKSKQKQWRKQLRDGEAEDNLRTVQAEQERAKEVDKDLYKVNVAKTMGKKEREALKADRFKQKEQAGKSKNEEAYIKKLALKEKVAPKKPEKEELEDLWATPTTYQKPKLQRDLKFLRGKKPQVKPVILPEGGQSYNPSLKDHKKLIESVVDREMKEVEEEEQRYKAFHAVEMGLVDLPGSDYEEVESDHKKDVIKVKPVDRRNQMTQADRNKKKLNKMRRRLEREAKTAKKFSKSFDSLPAQIKEVEQGRNERLAKLRQLKSYRKDEADKQAEVGEVKKGERIGRYKYNMRKADFQTEEELAGSLRTIQDGGKSLIRERYDSVFRRGLLEPVIPFDADKKKRKRKGVIKLHNRAGTYSLKLRAERLEIEKRVKDLEKGKKWMKDDVVAL